MPRFTLFQSLCSAFALWALAPASLAEPPELREATVTIPYSELRSLWEAAEKGEEKVPAPPVLAALHRAHYQLDLETGILRAEFLAESFAEGWQFVPLAGSQMAPIAVLTDDEGSRPVLRDGFIGLLFATAGERTCSMEFHIDPSELSKHQFQIHTAPATTATLEIQALPEGREIRLAGRPVPNPSPLPANGKGIQIELAEIEAVVPESPSSWEIRPEVLARLGGTRTEFEAQLTCHAEHGSGLELEFLLPANASVASLESGDIDRWASRQTATGRAVKVRWLTPGTLDRELRVTYHLPQSPSAENWNLPAPVVAGADPVPALYVVPHLEGVDLAGEGLAPATAATRLPVWMREHIAGRKISFVRTAEPPALTATWLPTVDIAGATVKDASFVLRIVEDGAMLVEADYHIENSAPLDWSLALPSDSRVLSCEINGSPAAAVEREGGALELSLPTPTGKETCNCVRISYAARTEAFDPVSGKLVLQLPRTVLFTHQLDWKITLPGNYLPTAIESNCTTASCEEPHKIHLVKHLCNDEAPTAEIHYQKQGLN